MKGEYAIFKTVVVVAYGGGVANKDGLFKASGGSSKPKKSTLRGKPKSLSGSVKRKDAPK